MFLKNCLNEQWQWTCSLPLWLAFPSCLPHGLQWQKIHCCKKNVVSGKLAVLTGALNKWNPASVRPVKTIKRTLYLERQGGFSHMLKANRLQTSTGSSVSRSVNLLWALLQFFPTNPLKKKKKSLIPLGKQRLWIVSVSLRDYLPLSAWEWEIRHGQDTSCSFNYAEIRW